MSLHVTKLVRNGHHGQRVSSHHDMISSQLQSDVMTPAVAQGTAQAAEAREDLITLAGFPLSLPCGFDSSCVENSSRLQSDSDWTELDVTIPEVPALR